MPGGDRTGPMGLGSMTGRGAGFCAGYPTPGYANQVGGRGFGMYGRGRGGWGRRNMYYATGLPGWQRFPAPNPVGDSPEVSKQQELNMLKNQAEDMSNQLKQVQQRIEQLQQKE